MRKSGKTEAIESLEIMGATSGNYRFVHQYQNSRKDFLLINGSAARMLMTFEEVIKNFGNRALRLKDVQRYLDSGGDINRRDEKMNWSLLHYAAEDCNPEIVRLLAVRGADVNARDKDGWTPLHWAVESDMDAASQQGRRASELPTVKALIEHGADTTAKATDGTMPRDIAASYGLEALYDSVAQSKVA